MDNAGVRFPPPLIFLTGLAIGYGLEALLPSTTIATAPRLAAGIALVVAGLALQTIFIRAFAGARTHVEPWKPTSAIVTTGIYGRTRNPAYIGMALIYAGVAVLSSALWALVVLPLVLVVIDRYVIAREERYLERAFGEEYLTYTRRVRRWV